MWILVLSWNSGPAIFPPSLHVFVDLDKVWNKVCSSRDENLEVVLQGSSTSWTDIESFKYLRVLINSEGKMDCEVNRKVSNGSAVPECSGSEGEALNSPVDHQSWPLGSD